MARPIHFEIPADDPARAIAFYSEALGWQAQKFDGMEYWLVRTGAEGERRALVHWIRHLTPKG